MNDIYLMPHVTRSGMNGICERNVVVNLNG